MSPEDLLHDPPVLGAPNRLRASRCRACARVEFPPAERCPACGGDARAIGIGPEARLGPRTAVLHAPPGALVDVPYVVGVAEFPEGISVIGLVDAPSLDDTRTGDVVDTIAHEAAPGLVTYAFRPR